MSTESYLVLGGATSVGEAIEVLLRRGEAKVSILDAEPLAEAQAVHWRARVRVFVQTLSSAQRISDVLRACQATCVIHAGRLSTPDTMDIRALRRRASIEGTSNLISAIIETGIKQLLYIGAAAAVFDRKERLGLREEDAPYPAKAWLSDLEPTLRGERLVLDANGRGGLATAVIRPAAIFGPVKPSRSPTYTTYRMLQRRAPQLSVCDIVVTDNTFVDNAAHAAVLAADRLAPTHAQHAATAGHAFFISDAAPRPGSALFRDIWAAVSQPVPARALPYFNSVGLGHMIISAAIQDALDKVRRRPDQQLLWSLHFLCARRTYDISLARDVLGYAPVVSHDEGIRRTAEWWLERQLKICKDKQNGDGGNPPPPYGATDTNPAAQKGPAV
ncbi:hypothetical protein DFH09DRAFT_923365 [Mycena vulgaris]|nr:hypothetical protein DFH09DRAFT_923365 [Mycena vulgaris]